MLTINKVNQSFTMFSRKAAVLIFTFLCVSSIGYAQGLTANNDEVYIGPLETVRVNVVRNDVVTCNSHTLRIVGYNSTKGTATLSGDFIVFRPAPSVRGETVTIQYGVTCNNIEKTATLSVHVSDYNRPGNVIAPDVECLTPFPSDVSFNVSNKFNTNTANPSHSHRLLMYSIPLVGDLNGDMKPEIISIGLRSLYSQVTASARYIVIMDGQTGATLVEFNTECSFIVSSDQPDASAYHSSPSYMAIADVDNDGKGEIIMAFPVARNTSGSSINADHSEQLFAYKVTTNSANEITGLQQYWKASDEYKAPLTGTNHLVYDVPAPYIADLNGDGIPEVIVYNKIYNAQTGRLLMAWDGPAAVPKNSSLTSGTGLYAYENSLIYTDLSTSNNVYNRAFTGRRPSTSTSVWKDDYIAVMAVENMDTDDDLEVIAGNRIYKFQFSYLGKDGESGSHTDNTYTTIEGPRSVTLPTGTSTSVTYYLSDGFTRVADVDGDGYPEVITVSEIATTGAYGSRAGGLITVWDPRYNTTIKAASAFHGNGGVVEHIPTFGVPFVGDINGKTDGGWNGGQFTKKLPEIGFITGDLYINSSTSTPKRNGITFHPLSDMNLRQGMGWDNNNTSASTRRFNRSVSGGQGHIFAVTYCDYDQDGAVPFHQRLKLSWAMEHSDRSANTGLTIFDFNNDGAKDLVYRDEETLRVISPKYGGKDYIDINETVGTGTSVLFRTDAYSFTGFEAAIVADVNMDASADIVVTNAQSSGDHLDGWVSVFEFSGTKWAPAPPVWNQAYYNPTQVREDLTIPARPQSLSTTYTLGGETITPYNGAWIQQPIVKEGTDYVPVIRLPDAVLTKMVVSSVNPTQVTLTIFNRGTASINANTPITFRDGGGAGLSLENSPVITTLPVGVDIFPNEHVTRTYTLTGNYSNKLIWVRIMDNGTSFPAPGYDDCMISDNSNQISGSDCVPEYVITASPDTVLCGHSGGAPATLTVTLAGATHTGALAYQWYRDETLIANATAHSYSTSLPGDYTCFVTEGVCRDYTPVKTLVVQYMEALDDYIGIFGGVRTIIDVLKNDIVPAACNPVVSVTENPQHGTCEIYLNCIEYTMDPTFTSGMDTLTYRLADGVTAKVYITVSEDPDNVMEEACYIPPIPTEWTIAEGWKSQYGDVESHRPWYVGDLDKDDIPEIVALSLDGKHSDSYNTEVYNKIVIFPGHDRDNPIIINTVDFGGDYYISAYGIAKIDCCEGIIVVAGADGYLYAYSYVTKAEKWRSNQPALWNTDTRIGAPTIGFADFNNDGIPEVYTGNRVFNAVNGYLLCDGEGNNKGFSIQNSASYGGSFPVAVDVDGDRKLELVAGNQAYKVTESAGVWSMTVYKTIAPPVLSNGVQVVDDGHVSIVNLNNDGQPDALISLVQYTSGVYYSILYGWDIMNNQLLFREHYESPTKSIPFVGNIDGDKHPEILTLFNNHLRAYKLPGTFGSTTGLTLFWDLAVDENLGHTGITSFDFNQDGAAELVYRDRSQLRIIDGSQNPPVSLDSLPCTSTTTWELPIVADVDGDRMAEIVVAGGTATGSSHMYIYTSDLANGTLPWAPARRVWNQYAYNAVNVNEDLTIPAKQFNPATTYPGPNGILGDPDDIHPFNTFLQQQTSLDKFGNPVLLAINAEIAGNVDDFYDATGDSLAITMHVYNAGNAPVRPPFYISVYKDTVVAANLMITDSITAFIYPGQTESIRIVIRDISSYLPIDSLHVRLNDNGEGRFLQAECNYSTNVIIMPLSSVLMANNDYVNTIVFTPVLIDVLANDSLPTSCISPDIALLGTPAHGMASIVNGQVQYIANAGFVGMDTILYSAVCGSKSSSAAVYVLVHSQPDNMIDLGSCFEPTGSGTFEIREQNRSPEDATHPGAVTLVGDLDGDGIPEIVSVASAGVAGEYQRIAILDGSTLQLKTSIDLSPVITENQGADGWMAPAPMLLVDANSNGMGEIIYAHNEAVHAYEADTTGGVFSMVYQWSTPYTRPAAASTGVAALPHPVVTDFNGDRIPELVVFNKILNASTGAVMGETEAIATAYTGRNPEHFNKATNFLTVADMDGDAIPEIVAGAAVYKVAISSDGLTATCHKVSQNTTIGDGFSAVADIDMDGQLEVVIAKATSSDVMVYVWWPDFAEGGAGTYASYSLSSSNGLHAFPTVGDIDGLIDSQTGKKYPEICIRTAHTISALKYNPATAMLVPEWQIASSGASGGSGITLFDFNNDGIQELVYRDQTHLRIIDGRASGADLGSVACASDTEWEYPVIADTDGDGSANICVPCGYRAVVFESVGKPWPPARQVWNQTPYESLHINENLTVSMCPIPKNMAFDGRYPYHGVLLQVPTLDHTDFSVVQPVANPAVYSIWTTQFDQTTVRVWVRIDNVGAKNTHVGLPVALYGKASAASAAELLQIKPVDVAIVPAGSYDMYFDVPVDSILPVLFVRLQDDGVNYPVGVPFLDCGPDNNTDSCTVVQAISDVYSMPSTVAHFAVLDNDFLGACPKGALSGFDLVQGVGMHHGTAEITADSTLRYTAAVAGEAWIDSLAYYIRCDADSSAATVYIVSHKPLSLYYIACFSATVTVGFVPVAGVQYDWYDAPVAGNLVAGNTAQRTVIKDNSAVQSWWVETSCHGIVFPRMRVDLSGSTDCGGPDPFIGCATTGVLLFKEDFGGNSPSDPETQPHGILQVTDYSYVTTLQTVNQYTISKTTNSFSNHAGWYKNLDDHTTSGNSATGYFIAFDADASPGQLYACTIDDLCPGLKLYISAWVTSFLSEDRADKTNLKFEVTDANGNVLSQYYTGAVPDVSPDWKQYGFEFTVPAGDTAITLRIFNHSTGADGCDFMIDDIEIRFCVPGVYTPFGEQGICVGDTLRLSGEYTDDGTFGDDLIAQWEYSTTGNLNDPAAWTPVGAQADTNNGRISHEYIVPNTTAGHAGYYRMVVANAATVNRFKCCVTSSAVQVTVESPPARPVIRPVANTCAGGELVFSVPALYAAYEWRANDSHGPVSGTLPYLIASSVGVHTYVVQVQSAQGCRSDYSLPVSGEIEAAAATPTSAITSLRTDYSTSPPTVTFVVAWPDNTHDCRHLTDIWLFIDHQPIANHSTGQWTRATLAGAPTLDAASAAGGSVSTAPGNDRGFWLHGLAGAYSATITVPVTALSPTFSWCAYASNYPPNATPASNDSYNLHGTAPFTVNDVSLGPATTFAGCIHSLTDATGCPGLIPTPPQIVSITPAAPTITAGDSVTLYVIATEAVEYSFDNGVTWSPNGHLTVAPATTTTYTVRVKSRGGCTEEKGTITVTVNG
ncbi:MAG: hypothetical protein LBF19_05795 [Prevotellaceae bacterium]|jgi:hypothetical protein|nr:hypothetical protein [Prevotellaceae bacterium]